MHIKESRCVAMTAGLVVATGFIAATALLGGEKAALPNLAGRWELVPEQSDDAGQAAEALLMPSHPLGERPMDRPGGRGGSGGWGGGGRGGPGGWGGGGRGGPGGWGGGGGGGRAGWGRPPDRERVPPTEEERVAMRDAVTLAIEVAPSIDVTQQDRRIEMAYPKERRRSLFTDGKKVEHGRWSRKAQWKKQRLVIETGTPRLKIQETFALSTEGERLQVEVRAKHDDFTGQLVLKRVYRKAVPTS